MALGEDLFNCIINTYSFLVETIFNFLIIRQPNQKAMNWQDYIVSDERVLLGKPTIKGTRLSVEFLLERLADGWTEQDLLDNYPRLTKEALRAVSAYTHR